MSKESVKANLQRDSSKSKRSKKRKARMAATPVRFEAVEPRLLLSASPIIDVDGAGGAPVTVDFEANAGIFPTLILADVTFTPEGGTGELGVFPVTIGTNLTQKMLERTNPVKKPIRATFTNPVSSVTVDIGDTDGLDQDELFLEVYDANDNLLDSVSLIIPLSNFGMETLTLSASNIAYAVMGGRDVPADGTPMQGSSVFIDNLIFTPQGGDVEVNEGDTATATGTFSDPDGDPVSLSASVGTVTDNLDGTWSWSYDTGNGPADSQTIVITATDVDGSTDATFDLIVNNVDPTLGVDSVLVTVDEGDTATNTGSLIDPGNDIASLTATVGSVVDNGDDTYTWSYDTNDGPDESQTVTITAIDTEGASAEIMFDLAVNNLPPDVAADQSSVTVDEGDVAANTGTVSDAGNDTVSLAASTGIVTDNGDGTWSWSINTTDGPTESQTVTIAATDSDGEDSYTMFDLVVSNVPPQITAFNSSAPMTNKSLDGDVSIDGAFADVGVNDTHTVTVDWGDDSALQVITTDQLADTFAGDHTYTTGGIFTVTVTVTDSDGDFTSSTTEAVVVGVGLNGGVLQVIGSDGSEKVTIRKIDGGNTIKVKVKEQGVGTTALVEFDATLINSIFVSGMGGNDMIVVAHSIDLDTQLNGDDGDDFIYGGGGNDVMNGGSGDDLLFGRDGTDEIFGGDGDDLIYGNGDGDTLHGGAGSDKIWGSIGADTINGGDGNDFLFGGAGDDVLNGDAGSDWLLGGSGNDTINGGDGNDILLGQAGNDILSGDAGDDILIGGPGQDQLDGGDGLDLLLDGWSWAWD